MATTTTTEDQPTPIRVDHDSLPFGRRFGYLTAEGLFIVQRDGAPWLWEVYVSIEAFTTLRHSHDALVANWLPSFDAAVAAAREAVAA